MISLKARRLVIVEGSFDFIQQIFNTFCEFTVNDSNFRQIRKNLAHLGQSYKCVGYDGTKRINPEILSSLLGTVRAGGLLFLGLNNLNELPDHSKFADEDQIKFKTTKKQKVQNNFLERFVNYIKNYPDTIYLNDENFSQQRNFIEDTLESISQSSTVATIKINPKLLDSISTNQVNIIYGSRGSGKSTLLSALSNKLIEQGNKLIITGPTHYSVSTILQNAPDCVFTGVDELLDKDYQCEYLIVDEAGSIPLPKLKKLILKSNHIILAGTCEGYEGTGIGFTLKLQDFLEEHQLSFFKHILEGSYRFDKDCLGALWSNIFTPHSIIPTDISLDDFSNICFKHINSTELSKNEELLKQTYTLLARNHYQTSPSDLRQLLDNPANHLFYLIKNDMVIGILWGDIEEGNEKLLNEIFYNRRRPQGNLLPQTLISHCGFKNACFYKFFRTIRIAVLPNMRRKGLGSKLLSYAEDELKNLCDFFGTSFGATEQLLSFWNFCGYEAVKLGLREDGSSGLFSVVMLKTIGKLKKEVLNQWRDSFIENLIPASAWQFKEIDPLIIAHLFAQNSLEYPYPTNYLRNLDSLANGLRSPEHCIASVTTWIAYHVERWHLWSDTDQKLLIGYFLQHQSNISSSQREHLVELLRNEILATLQH